jgi:multiple sugar transport system permease protein
MPRDADIAAGAPPQRRSAARREPGLVSRVVAHRADYLYVAPALLVMLLVIGYPIYDTVYLSFFDTPPSLAMADKSFIGLDNYARILTSPAFLDVTINTAIWTVASTVFAFALGFGAALALNREFMGRGLMRAILLVPYVISGVAASYIWQWLYHSDFGVIGAALMAVGLTGHQINFLDNTQTVLPALIVVNVWKEFSFAMIMMLAGLQTVPDQLHHAATVDGAGPWDRFWHVTAPHLRGVGTVTLLLLLVSNLNSFIIPWIMTGGGPVGASDLWITAIYSLAFEQVRFGIASAYSVIVFIVMMGVGYFYVRALAGEREAVR